MHAKSYEDIEEHVAPWTGEQEFVEIVEAIERRGGQRAPPIPLEDVVITPLTAIQENRDVAYVTTTELAAPSQESVHDEATSIPLVLGLEVAPIGSSGEAIVVQ